MTWRRVVAACALLVAALLVLPPAVVYAEQASLALRSEQQGRYIAASQLYDAWQEREEYLRLKNLIDHPFEYPYLRCDAELPRSMADVDETLILTLMRDHAARLRFAYARSLEAQLPIWRSTALTACIEATPFAARCADRVRDLTYGHDERIDMSAGDSRAANAYCRSVKALLQQVKT